MYYFTADEHYSHKNILKYSKRPFSSIEDHDEELICRHNIVVKSVDTVIHIGDFTLKNKEFASSVIRRLNGNHIFIKGSHDYWLKNAIQIWEKKIEDIYVVCCHYPMISWPRSHYGSWQLFGHCHGSLDTDDLMMGKQIDVGVDTHDYFPYSFEEIKNIMKGERDNWNLLKRKT